MPRRKSTRTIPMTNEDRENQLIAEATALAEQRIRDGTAPTQVIIHYLKLGTEKTRLENEKLKTENKLLEAKIEALESQKQTQAIYEEALNAMRTYSGHGYEADNV